MKWKIPLLAKEGLGEVEITRLELKTFDFDMERNPKKTKKKRRYLRNNMTKWEIYLWNDLKSRKMYGFKVRRQYGFDNYVVDFYCPELKLAVEVDGDFHYFEEKIRTDREKDRYLKQEGIKVIRIKTLDLEEDYESMIVYLEAVFKDRAAELNKGFENM
ncbi:endonuclease domain-containing protein [Rhodohalobacter sp. WB101]|uniref:Endonuclease domain-containing protein n=2 Tax=Rhodohalobacter sulfatireducens TaxID=2911366 RepID=A0ABS9KBK7_9BACT|nr:endonuclease domain-containing protein [Rhodohalobacter sulfatireducens]